MPGRYMVRRYHTDPRAVVLPERLPRQRTGEDYEPPPSEPVQPEPEKVEEKYIAQFSRKDCRTCGQRVKFDERRQSYYSHNLPDSCVTCPRSGMP